MREIFVIILLALIAQAQCQWGLHTRAASWFKRVAARPPAPRAVIKGPVLMPAAPPLEAPTRPPLRWPPPMTDEPTFAPQPNFPLRWPPPMTDEPTFAPQPNFPLRWPPPMTDEPTYDPPPAEPKLTTSPAPETSPQPSVAPPPPPPAGPPRPPTAPAEEEPDAGQGPGDKGKSKPKRPRGSLRALAALSQRPSSSVVALLSMILVGSGVTVAVLRYDFHRSVSATGEEPLLVE
eukprot:gnl/TRDRNA2_/TRDRNA2_89834_c0_seq1.p1 gnl/TRDRNA2_/TRDRNA2_89834_c0~~gnl/TRDRNA2_/TRDRNA2_89834_c0_seq1.p1  ORF type:complete len:234 (-),score=38.43 gnl/TRDRNA2_/TRDRNA2_89834_c0_seq1:233-934(-)